MQRTKRYVLAAGAAFFATVSVCVAMRPSVLWGHAGLSFYGNFKRTLLPYGGGLAATAYFLLRASQAISGRAELAAFRFGLDGMAIGLLGIIATPSLSPLGPVQRLHDVFGFVIFLAQATLTVDYLARRAAVRRIDWLLAAAQGVAILLIFLSFSAVGVLDVTLPAQLLAVLTFGLLFTRAIHYMKASQA